MLVKRLQVVPGGLGRHILRCSSSLQASEATRESIDKQSLRSNLVSKSDGMEKDLHALESELARSAKKQDLLKIKKKWSLKTIVYGADIGLESARQALASELRERLQELRLQAGVAAKDGVVQTPHGGILSAVAASQKGWGHTVAAGDSFGPTKLILGGLVVGLCGLAFLKFDEARSASSPRAETPLASIQAAPVQTGGSKSLEAVSGTKSEGEQPQESKVEAKEPLQQGTTRSTGAAGVGHADEMLKLGVGLGVGLVLVLGLAMYFWRGHPPTTGPEGETLQPEIQADTGPAEPPVHAGSLEASVHRQAEEVVFENAPKESQVWDMSASVRGIKGGVSDKISMFQR